jgi:hypothetical protein
VEHEELLRATYEAFNARDIETSLRQMVADVDWPNAWEVGASIVTRVFVTTGRVSGRPIRA